MEFSTFNYKFKFLSHYYSSPLKGIKKSFAGDSVDHDVDGNNEDALELSYNEVNQLKSSDEYDFHTNRHKLLSSVHRGKK